MVGVFTERTFAVSADSRVTGCVREQARMGAFFAKFRRQPAQSDDAPRGPSRVTDQDKAVFVSKDPQSCQKNSMILITSCVVLFIDV